MTTKTPLAAAYDASPTPGNAGQRGSYEPVRNPQAGGTLGALRGLIADLPDSTPIVVVMRKAHDLDHFYASVNVEGEHVDLTFGPAVVLTVPEPGDLDD